ncbi:carbohydrate-binding protein [Ruminococcus flavefaciens]|uniref:carbohydrate-binding protein n=1 Tax=Ruminococcus flavefaciens TaxID=1265 RepID=UPI0026EB5CB0|nr:carbohydrate-binding protein [Ruminococcus flavefaciens]
MLREPSGRCFRIGSNGARAALEVRLDSSDGKLIGKPDVSETGGWQTWKTQKLQNR